MKICTKCKVPKPLTEFYKQTPKGNRYKDGYKYNCKECYTQPTPAYYQKHRDKIIAYSAKRYATKKEEILLKAKDYKEKRKSVRNAWEKKRKLTDTNYRLACNLRSRLAKAIREDWKAGSAIRDLGCSIQDLKNYLESKWQQGMSWDNWTNDGWHIDHITPLCVYNLDDPQEFKNAVHYSNLQPLWAEQNLIKSGSQTV